MRALMMVGLLSTSNVICFVIFVAPAASLCGFDRSEDASEIFAGNESNEAIASTVKTSRISMVAGK
jgi:hypothetical protein